MELFTAVMMKEGKWGVVSLRDRAFVHLDVVLIAEKGRRKSSCCLRTQNLHKAIVAAPSFNYQARLLNLKFSSANE